MEGVMKIVVPFAPGFEEIEALTVVDVLRRAGIEALIVPLSGNEITGSHNITVKGDPVIISEIKSDDFDGIVLPGGMPGSKNLKENSAVLRLIYEFNQAGKLVAAVCAAPIVLAAAGVIKGKNISAFPGYDNELKEANYTSEPFTVDGNIITGKSAGSALPFALEIVKYLLGSEASEKLKKAMFVYWM